MTINSDQLLNTGHMFCFLSGFVKNKISISIQGEITVEIKLSAFTDSLQTSLSLRYLACHKAGFFFFFAKIKALLQNKGGTSAIAKPKQEKALFSTKREWSNRHSLDGERSDVASKSVAWWYVWDLIGFETSILSTRSVSKKTCLLMSSTGFVTLPFHSTEMSDFLVNFFQAVFSWSRSQAVSSSRAANAVFAAVGSQWVGVWIWYSAVLWTSSEVFAASLCYPIDRKRKSVTLNN